ncbi:MAG: site-specific tyrosine recombinase XerD [Actinobacteria bacterium]|nr:site-specific tyrosine recombinase XerD [Actinomycetota bacterium]
MPEEEKEEIAAVVRAGRDFLNWLQVEKGASKNTILAYRRVIVRYGAYLDEAGVVDLGGISREVLVDYSHELSSENGLNLSSRSVAQAYSVIRMFHRFLVTEGWTENDPSGVLDSPRMPMRLPRALSLEQIEKLLSAPAGDEPVSMRDRAIMELLYATGMRISELVGLDVRDMQTEEMFVRCKGKGDKWRIVPYGKETDRVLSDYIDAARPEIMHGKGSPAVFLNLRGGRLTRQGCWMIIKKHAKSAGLEDVVTPHVLRHTFATHMLEGGANLLVVQELLGHVSVSTTQIYTSVSKKHLIDIYNKAHPRAL